MPASFQSLSELLEKVEATKKRLEIIDLTANYLKTLSAEEIEASRKHDGWQSLPKIQPKNPGRKLVNPNPCFGARKPV